MNLYSFIVITISLIITVKQKREDLDLGPLFLLH